jgi:hypothetical protein
MRVVHIFAGALLLAGCGSQRSESVNQAEPANVQATGNTIAALPEGARNAVFIRAIRDSSTSGERCQHVESSQAAGEYRGNPVWRARCADGSSWTIVVTAPDTVQIIDDAEARLAGVNLTEPAANEAAPAANAQGQ